MANKIETSSKNIKPRINYLNHNIIIHRETSSLKYPQHSMNYSMTRKFGIILVDKGQILPIKRWQS